ncbi:hypothetical protein DL764_000300 [Monosporascus ibericus]|uniref:Uncharacterized protein n=1 Tax=Monosporascus ibericus TaxID=155417 RepID=A0A4Q4TZB1_9PEZI|nr:hypothetical protein DL764_000300 [Monosporascus ibericus]
MEDASQAIDPADKLEGPVCVDGSFIVKHNHAITLAGDIWVEEQLSAPSTNVLEVHDQLCCKGDVTAGVLRLRNGTLYSDQPPEQQMGVRREISVGPTGQVVYGSLVLEGKGMIKASITYVQSLLHNSTDANYIIGGAVIVNGDVKVARGSVLYSISRIMWAAITLAIIAYRKIDDLVVLGDLHVHSGALLTAHKVTVGRTTIVDTGGQFIADKMNGCGIMRINLEE